MAIPPATVARPIARLSARVFAYLVDSVVLLAFILVFFVLAGLQLLVAANRVASNGDVACNAAPPAGADVIAVVLLDAEPRGAIVQRCDATTKTSRILCDHAIFEVSDEGLVIVELAPGVSAKDLQKKVQPTLLISPNVTEMIVSK